jgi:hypothetical protein
MAYDDRVMDVATCDPNSNTSFPLNMAITVTDTIYDSVSEPITIDFQWATRSTPPAFTTNSMIDEVGAGNANLSTLRYLNKTYTVASVQIIQSSHTSWILPNTAQAGNKEDIAITYSNELSSTPYITFIIPIIRTSSNASINYLNGLANPTAAGSFSLQSCFPTNKRARFAFYSTCLKGSGANTPSQNMHVFVAVNGISIGANMMEKVLKNLGNVSFAAKMTAPYSTRLSGANKTITNMESFTQYVMSTTELMNFTDFKQSYTELNTNINIRKDDVGAYKCVQVDPDSIVNGQIQVDVSTGEVLKDVLSERDAIRDTYSVNRSIDKNRFLNFFHSGMGIFVAIILCIILLFCIFYGILYWTGSFKNPDLYATPTTSFQYAIKMLSSPASSVNYIILFIIAGFIGFIIGAMIN